MYIEELRDNLEKQRNLLNDMIRKNIFFIWLTRFFAVISITAEIIMPYDAYPLTFGYAFVVIWPILEYLIFIDTRKSKRMLNSVDRQIFYVDFFKKAINMLTNKATG